MGGRPLDIALLPPDRFDAAVPELAAVLIDCVQGGASVGFLASLTTGDAEGFWRAALRGAQTLTWTAATGGRLVACVQLHLAARPNARHRAEVAKLLVAREARGRGIAGALMGALEAEAARRERTLLLLDTQTGSDAERCYRRLGWVEVGVVPEHSSTPEGRLDATTIMMRRLPLLSAGASPPGAQRPVD